MLSIFDINGGISWQITPLSSSKPQISFVIIHRSIPQCQLVILLSEPLTRRLIALNYKCDIIIFHDWGSEAAMMKS